MKKFTKNHRLDFKMIGLGIAAAITISIILSAIVTALFLRGSIGINAVRYVTFIIHMLSLTIVGLLLKVLAAEPDPVYAVLVGVGYTVSIFVGNFLIFNSGIYNVLFALLGVLLGVLIGVLQIRPRKNQTIKRLKKIKIR